MLILTKPCYNLKSIIKISHREYSLNREEVLQQPFKTRNNFILEKGTVNTRYFPTAIREWKNSVYSFNKNSEKNVVSKDIMTNKLIKSYFYFSNLKTRPRSKRMRSLRRKFTSKKLFISRPEIKQTNDKVIVTIFTFNRERRFLLKKLFFYNRRRVILDLWRKNNKLTPFVEQYKKLNFLLVNENYNRKISSSIINNTTNNIIKQNKEIYAQFNSDLISKKDKIALYSKIYDKVSRNVYKTSVFDNQVDKNKNNFHFLIDKSKINRYKRRRIKRFKKRIQIRKKTWYIRKKMKKSKSILPRLTKKQRRKLGKRIIPYSGIKFKNEMNFLSYKLLMKNKQLAYGRKLFYFYFLKYVLSMFNIKVFAFKDSNIPSSSTMNDIIQTNELLNIENKLKKNRKGKRNKKTKFTYKIEKNTLSLFKSPLSLKSKGTKIKLCFYKLKRNVNNMIKTGNKRTNSSISGIMSRSKPIIINMDILQNNNKIDNMDNVLSNVNFVISQFLNKVLIKSKITDKERKLYILYKKYSKKHYKNFIARIGKKQKLFSKYYTRLMINRFKFNKLLPNLKLLISKIYNKKIELNLVNLKYSHLNTDIYSETISLKLRKRLNLLKVIRKALKLAKRPTGFKDKSKIDVDYDLNKISNFNIYKSLKLKNLNENSVVYGVSLQNILDKIYPRSMVLNTNYLTNKLKDWNGIKIINSKLKNILNIIKYKTLSGVRIEAAGRLTKRYTASRAVFKFRYKGNLKDIDYSRILEHQKKSLPTVMLRNQVKANSQYSFNFSKRRVGAFGVKGWISGY